MTPKGESFQQADPSGDIRVITAPMAVAASCLAFHVLTTGAVVTLVQVLRHLRQPGPWLCEAAALQVLQVQLRALSKGLSQPLLAAPWLAAGRDGWAAERSCGGL